MKGTEPRRADPVADQDAVRALAADPKQRAENLMIVDLIRNDVSREAVPGSVAVPALFTIETYPTIHQMTSTVTADLAAGQDAIALIEAAFPCGSITNGIATPWSFENLSVKLRKSSGVSMLAWLAKMESR